MPELAGSPVLPNSVGFAVCKQHFGVGEKHLVFLLFGIGVDGEFNGPSVVAKASRREQIPNLDSLRKWQISFMRTQMRAAMYVTKFNKQPDNKHVYKDIHRIEVFPRFIDRCQTDTSNGWEGCNYLSEKRLGPNNHKKWNNDSNNNGGADGQVKHNYICYGGIINSTDFNDKKKMLLFS